MLTAGYIVLTLFATNNAMWVEASMFVEAVWAALREGTWRSAELLKTASGLDDERLMRIVNFLHRWKFVEVHRFPKLRVRRRSGVISPVLVFELLRGTVKKGPHSEFHVGRRRIAERVACRICSGRTFRFVGMNEVECAECHERQWFTIEVNELSPSQHSFKQLLR